MRWFRKQTDIERRARVMNKQMEKQLRKINESMNLLGDITEDLEMIVKKHVTSDDEKAVNNIRLKIKKIRDLVEECMVMPYANKEGKLEN
jgi:hypothetical protein